MSGRPYRGGGEGFREADLRPPEAADDAALFALLLSHPDFLSEDVAFVGDGRVVAESDPAWRTVLGWRRAGGPLLLGLTAGPAAAELLVEAMQLAEAGADWPIASWDAVLAAYWGSADPALRKRVAERWKLGGRIGALEAWTEAAWGEPPAPGRAAVGILSARVPDDLRRAVEWLARGGREVAAFEVLRMEAGNGPTYWATRVAGSWRASTEPPPRAAGHRREMYLRNTGSETAGLLAAVEARCLEAGSEVAWSGQEWVRFDGGGHSVRVFPGAAWVDLQFVGADEGTLTGLRYRYGVPGRLSAPADSPPGIHLRLQSREDLSPAVELLLATWLSGEIAPRGASVEEVGSRSRPAAEPAAAEENDKPRRSRPAAPVKSAGRGPSPSRRGRSG